MKKRHDMNEQGMENEPLLVGDEGGAQRADEDTKPQTRPNRTIIVEPLVVLYVFAGMPLGSLKSQYMYQKIAADMGIDLGNLSSKYFYSRYSCKAIKR